MIIKKIKIKSLLINILKFMLLPNLIFSILMAWSFGIIFHYSKISQFIFVCILYVWVFSVVLIFNALIFCVLYNIRKNKNVGIVAENNE